MIDNATWEHIITSLDNIKTQETKFNEIVDVMQVIPESDLCESFNAIIVDLLTTLSVMVDDDFGTFAWWVYENDYGKGGLEAGVDGEIKSIDSLDKLKWLIGTQRETKSFGENPNSEWEMYI